MSLVPCLSIHVYLRILCKIHVSGSITQHPYVFQGPLQDPCLRFMSQDLYMSGSSARSMSPDPCLSIHLYLRILSKIHVSDSCLSIHQSGSSTRSMYSDSCLSIFASHGFYARPMFPDPCLSILFSQSSTKSLSSARCLSIFVSHDPLQDPCLRINVSASLYLRILYKIHVFGFMS